MSVLVVVSGLPAVGKSTIAAGLGLALRFVVFELDVLEAPLLRRGISGDSIGWASYEALTAIARQNIHSVDGLILDAVGWTEKWRSECKKVAEAARGRFRPIEVVCSDEALHKQRIEGRANDPARRFRLSSWSDLEAARRSYWEPWSGDRLILDTKRPAKELIQEAVEYVSGP